MRKLIWLIHTSLDGMVSGPNGEMDWAARGMDDELWGEVWSLIGSVDVAVFGRGTFRDFESYWPAVPRNPSSTKNERDFSQWIDQAAKVVASNSMHSVSWQNSRVLNGIEGVAQMKKLPGKDMLLFGSPGFASQLMKAKLIDEMRMEVHPLLLGSGRPLFGEIRERCRLRLRESKAFASGVVGLKYDFLNAERI